jgi:hypothetical protein
MRHGLRVFLTATLALGVTGIVRADDQDAKAVLDKALKAQGAGNPAHKAMVVKSKGTVHIMGQAMPFTGEIATEPPRRSHQQFDMDFMGQKFKVVMALDGNKGFRDFNGNAAEMDDENVAAARQAMHNEYIATLRPLKDPAYKLTALGESKVDGKPVVGIKVSHDKFKDVSLFFDKETYLLVKTEATVKDPMAGQELKQETYYSDFKEKDGVKRPMKIVIKRDGQVFVENEVIEYKPLEKLDDSLFKPGA